MEEIIKIRCQKCGEIKPQRMFKKTRWGNFSIVCNECVAAARHANAQKKINSEIESVKVELEKARLLRISEFSPRELMQELARRGYEGKLTYTTTHTIDITNF